MANSLDSNGDCTRLVADGWLELCLSDGETTLGVISTALELRADWERLLQAQLSKRRPSARDLERLGDRLVRFLLYTEVQ